MCFKVVFTWPPTSKWSKPQKSHIGFLTAQFHFFQKVSRIKSSTKDKSSGGSRGSQKYGALLDTSRFGDFMSKNRIFYRKFRRKL